MKLLRVQDSGNGIIDGSKYPELIPDDRAYHVVLLAASASEDTSNIGTRRAAAIVRSIHLTNADARILTDVAARYRKTFLAESAIPSDDDMAFEQSRQNRIRLHIDQVLSRLTPLGVVKFNAYVQRAKEHIKLVPLPDMSTHRAGLWRRLFSLQVVHAQGMGHPYGSISSFLTPDGATPVVWGVGVTDSSASCSCHVSSVWTTITAPSGGKASQYSVGQSGGYAEADAEYNLQSGDFANGDYTIDSTHTSYCPFCSCNFINDEDTSAVATSRYIQAYYYCTPKGGPCYVSYGAATYNRCRPQGDDCDTVLGFKLPKGYSNFPPYMLANAVLLVFPSKFGGTEEGCIGGSITQSDSCGTIDPKP